MDILALDFLRHLAGRNGVIRWFLLNGRTRQQKWKNRLIPYRWTVYLHECSHTCQHQNSDIYPHLFILLILPHSRKHSHIHPILLHFEPVARRRHLYGVLISVWPPDVLLIFAFRGWSVAAGGQRPPPDPVQDESTRRKQGKTEAKQDKVPD